MEPGVNPELLTLSPICGLESPREYAIFCLGSKNVMFICFYNGKYFVCWYKRTKVGTLVSIKNKLIDINNWIKLLINIFPS